MSDDEYGGLTAQAAVKQAAGRKPSSAGAKVTVACNLPAGIRIRNFKMVPSTEPVLGGGVRETVIAEPVGEDILINGVAVAFGFGPRHRIVAGYALTEGVDKESWDAWRQANINSAMVKNGCVFAYERDDRAVDAAKDHQGARSGLEPFVPSDDPKAPKDPRSPRRSSQNLTEVTRATEDLAA